MCAILLCHYLAIMVLKYVAVSTDVISTWNSDWLDFVVEDTFSVLSA
jgi:hypothetical protein